MTRPGRRRKGFAARQPNGQIRRLPQLERQGSVMAIASAAPHRRAKLPNGKSTDPTDARLGDELGRLLLRGHISGAQYAAGRRWGSTIDRLRRAIDAPLDRPRGVLGSLSGSSGPSTDMSPEEAREAMLAYSAASRALMADRHIWRRNQTRRALSLVIQLDHPTDDLPQLRYGLDVLGRHFEGKTAMSENREP